MKGKTVTIKIRDWRRSEKVIKTFEKKKVLKLYGTIPHLFIAIE